MNTSPVGGLQLLLNHRHKYNIKEISIHVTTVEKVKKKRLQATTWVNFIQSLINDTNLLIMNNRRKINPLQVY